MRYRVFILVLVIIGICGFCLTQSELSVLRYQLQMPTIAGNAAGFRMVGTIDEGAFGAVWKLDRKLGLFTGQVLAFNSVLSKWLETGVFEWSKVYFDIYLLLRF